MFSSLRRTVAAGLNGFKAKSTRYYSHQPPRTFFSSRGFVRHDVTLLRPSQAFQPIRHRSSNTYQRFDNRQVGNKLKVNRYYLVGIVGLGGVFYVANLERVPISNRLRFNIISPEEDREMAKQAYQQIMQQNHGKILPSSSPESRQVRQVLNRLIPASGLEDLEWETFVIDDRSTMNAFVIPGGKVFVFSGILEITQNEDALATVLSHEIAHVLAHHTSERASQMFLISFGAYLLAWMFGAPADFSAIAADLALARPSSRTQESEADYIGLMMMASACFDPNEAANFWTRMGKASEFSIPQFLSTHPNNKTRMKQITGWLPEANDKRQGSNCAATIGYAQEFHEAFEQIKW